MLMMRGDKRAESDLEGEGEDSSEKKGNEEDLDSISSTPQSTEFKFNQEILRRRMAAFSNPQKPETIIDFSTLAGSVQYHPAPSQESLQDHLEDVSSTFDKLSHVWVILFTNRDGTDGIYSLSLGTDNIVLVFQERIEAHRYAMCLEAQKFPRPQICEMDPEEIRNFCTDEGLKLGFIPSGMVISPPEESAIDDLDKWRGKPGSEESVGMSEQDIEAMRNRLDSLFGQ